MKLGPVVALFGFVGPALAQYAGPAILSRGEAPTGLVAPEIRFNPYVGVSAVWDTGLANVSVNSQGQLASSSAFGASLAWGVSGRHSWRRTALSLMYSGSIDHYFGQGNYDSINQILFVGLVHQLSRRMVLSVHAGAGIYSRLTTPIGLNQTLSFDPTTTYVPTTDYFDNRTIYGTIAANLTYRKTARLSFDVGGVGAIVDRRSDALYGTEVAGAQGDLQYRVSAHSTLGAAYTFQEYWFSRIFGGTNSHQMALTYAIRLTPKTEFGGYAGAAYTESEFVTEVPLDPAIAALLGIADATYVSYSHNWFPAYSARLSRVLPKGVAYAGVTRAITPGNGLFLTSTGTSYFAGYDFGGKWKHWSLGTYTSFSQQQSIGGVQGRYSTESVGVSAARHLFRYTQFVMGFAARHYGSPDYTTYNRMVYSAHVGLGFAPGEVPLRLW